MMRAIEFPMTVTALVSPADGVFTAHALEFDILCQGETKEEATSSLKRALIAYISFGLQRYDCKDVSELLFPAPAEYWDRAKGTPGHSVVRMTVNPSAAELEGEWTPVSPV